jgi:hypothetical protein
MQVNGYLVRGYKNKIEFLSDADVAVGNRWRKIIRRDRIKDLTVTDETVRFYDNVKKNCNRIGQACKIELH